MKKEYEAKGLSWPPVWSPKQGRIVQRAVRLEEDDDDYRVNAKSLDFNPDAA